MIELGERYYYIDDYNDIEYFHYDEGYTWMDAIIRERGVYRTRDEAEWVFKQYEFIEEVVNDFSTNVDWDDFDEAKYYIDLEASDDGWKAVVKRTYVLIDGVRFYSHDRFPLYNYVKNHQKELLEYFFGIGGVEPVERITGTVV